MPFKPFDPNEAVHNHRKKLPHWRQWGRTCFITSRLADSLPSHVLKAWHKLRDAWLGDHGISSAQELDRLTEELRHAYHREFTSRFHELLDAGHGECHLANATYAEMLVSKLIAGCGTNYQIDAWVIMPNHFHALVEPAEGVVLGDIVQRWKGGSAREINLARHATGKLWQREPFDHIVRSEAQMNHFRRYIALNPVKAGLKSGVCSWSRYEIRPERQRCVGVLRAQARSIVVQSFSSFWILGAGGVFPERAKALEYFLLSERTRYKHRLHARCIGRLNAAVAILQHKTLTRGDAHQLRCE